MTSRNDVPQYFEAGDILLWQIKASTPDLARACAEELGDLATVHELGDWAVNPIGLGDSWWFDLTLSAGMTDICIILTFSRLPDHCY